MEQSTAHSHDSSQHSEPPRVLLAIARAAIAAHLQQRPYAPPAQPPPWRSSRGVFVTLREESGALRGCIGHMEPVLESLSEEVASCAISAATRDPRFYPVVAEELEGLTIELSILARPEAIADATALDPQRYGVVVAADGRRGVLLPQIDGVDTPAQQIAIAARKAGLDATTPLKLWRFQVQKIAEEVPERAAGRPGHGA
ncbi:MAG: AmmeMemoRadiSam system protein A [Myxococcales bacterium]|nr:AmmeMemoRadiSam system protein A [Myxococcales bacterium]